VRSWPLREPLVLSLQVLHDNIVRLKVNEKKASSER
jgi:hypothetical protein